MMLKVSWKMLRRALWFYGWLDKQTGEFICPDRIPSQDGGMELNMDPNILIQSDRYIQVPFLHDAWACAEIIKKKCVDPEILQRYGIDLQKVQNVEAIQYLSDTKIPEYTENERDFLNGVDVMVNELQWDDVMVEYGDKLEIDALLKWCEDNDLDPFQGRDMEGMLADCRAEVEQDFDELMRKLERGELK